MPFGKNKGSGYAKPKPVTEGATGKTDGGSPLGMRQTYKQTGEVKGCGSSKTTQAKNSSY